MIEIHTITKRKTRGSYAVLTREQRQIVVSLEPGDVLGFRELRTRTTFALPILDVYRLAIRYKVEADRRARREGRATR